MKHAVWDAGRTSPVGSPFADRGQRSECVAHAYDDWLALVLWFGVTGCVQEAVGLPQLLARRHAVSVSEGRHDVSIRKAWDWLLQAALVQSELVISGPGGDAARGHPGRRCLDSVAGAITWLKQRILNSTSPAATPPLKAGDWAVAHIYSRWPADIASELATFCWPITTKEELARLIACTHASPQAIMAFEFTASVRSAYEYHWRFMRVAISVDRRTSLQPGPHVRMDVRDVMWSKVWKDAFLHPPCTHQVRGDSLTSTAKHADGRTFWGVAMFVYCWCIKADRVMVEQPNTVIPDHYLHPTQCIRPCDVGDDENKPIHLFERGGRKLLPKSPTVAGVSGHKRLRDFEGPEARDRWRSSWARFPMLSKAVVEAVDEAAPAAVAPCYAEEIERFACNWYDAGLPVPADYAAPDAQPASDEDRAYQEQRGKGDGRRVQGVTPRSRGGYGNTHALSTTGGLSHSQPHSLHTHRPSTTQPHHLGHA